MQNHQDSAPSSESFECAGALELFPNRWKHMFDKKMRCNKEIERVARSHVIGLRSR